MMYNSNEKLTVICVLQAIKGKEDDLKNALREVIEPSRLEKHCIEYKLHQDRNNPAQFILYEQWENSDLHAEQFKKPYICSLSTKLKTLLAKPYQIFFASELM